MHCNHEGSDNGVGRVGVHRECVSRLLSVPGAGNAEVRAFALSYGTQRNHRLGNWAARRDCFNRRRDYRFNGERDPVTLANPNTELRYSRNWPHRRGRLIRAVQKSVNYCSG
jgi:hypothetical protein